MSATVSGGGSGEAGEAGEAGMPMLGEVLLRAAADLRAAGSATPRLDAELLMARTLDFTRVQLYTESQLPLEPLERARFAALLARRLAHEPVQYILGTASFRNLELEVDGRVLIPRPETELLVEWALEFVGERWPQRAPGEAVRVLDVCTGSGAIAIAIADEAPSDSVHVTACDLSAGALEVARANVARCGVEVEVLQGDLMQPVSGRSFDVIVANPPYVPAGERETLDPNVREYEPHLALFVDGDDPTGIAQAIAHGAIPLLRPGSLVAVEIGMGQYATMAGHFRAAGYVDVEVRPDLAGIDRVVGARWPGR